METLESSTFTSTPSETTTTVVGRVDSSTQPLLTNTPRETTAKAQENQESSVPSLLIRSNLVGVVSAVVICLASIHIITDI
jgi:hypothetical protein